MQKLIIIKYGELTTKKDNINFFLKALKKNVEDALSNIKHTTSYDASRMFIKTTDFDKTIEKLNDVIAQNQKKNEFLQGSFLNNIQKRIEKGYYYGKQQQKPRSRSKRSA